jgi:hypothetical protein
LLLIAFAIFVFAFAGWVLLDRFREQPTGAQRLAFVTSLAGGCAAGIQGSSESPLVHGLAWGVVAGLGGLTAYARWRERERARLTRPNEI